MKKILLSLVLLAGISSVSTYAAEEAPTEGRNDCYKRADPGLILLPDDCKPARTSCSSKPRPCEEEAVKKQMVNFVALGGSLGGSDLSTFTSFTTPGQGLTFVYKKDGGSNSFSVRLSTDQSVKYDRVSPDSQYPIWRAKAPLCFGTYIGKLYLADKFEKTSCSDQPILESKFTINYVNDLVVISK